MSRDQKPGRSEKVAGSPVRATATAAPQTPVAGPGMAPAAPKRPIALLASLFVVASIAGGIGFALSGWQLR